MTKKPISTELAELFDLLNSGAITKEEYDSLKKQILTKDNLENTENKTEEVPDYKTKADSVQSKKSNRIWLYAIAGVVFIFIAFMILKTFAFPGKPDNSSSINDTTLNVSAESKSNSLNKSGNFDIKQGSVGDILIGGKIDQISKEYTINKKIETGYTEDGGEYEQVVFEIYKEGNLLLKLDQEPIGKTINWIGVLSTKYKTIRGIGIGSTINEFIKSYQNYIIRYEYLAGEFIIRANELENVKFQFEDPGYSGSKTEENLKYSDFNPNSRIVSISLLSTN